MRAAVKANCKKIKKGLKISEEICYYGRVRCETGRKTAEIPLFGGEMPLIYWTTDTL